MIWRDTIIVHNDIVLYLLLLMLFIDLGIFNCFRTVVDWDMDIVSLAGQEISVEQKEQMSFTHRTSLQHNYVSCLNH